MGQSPIPNGIAGRRDNDSTTVDVDGNAAAITHSTGVSAGVVTPGLGFQHNCHMIQFDPIPGRFNSIAPWKRAVTGGGPAFFMRDGSIDLAIGSPAGARKVTALIQAFLNMKDFGMTPQEAVAAERIHVEDVPRQIIVGADSLPRRRSISPRSAMTLSSSGTTARLTGVHRATDGTLTGASDPAAIGAWRSSQPQSRPLPWRRDSGLARLAAVEISPRSWPSPCRGAGLAAHCHPS